MDPTDFISRAVAVKLTVAAQIKDARMRRLNGGANEESSLEVFQSRTCRVTTPLTVGEYVWDPNSTYGLLDI